MTERDGTMAAEDASARVAIVEPQPGWADRAASLTEAISTAAGTRVVRVDHIGSTSVPGLPAKDVVDVQAMVSSLDPRQDLANAFGTIGLRAPFGLDGAIDHVPAGWVGHDVEWEKMFFSGVFEGGRCNVHVRIVGRANERYALLFRDYLRADAVAREMWALFKIRLAEIADDIEEYVEVKDAATDVLLHAAERWAEDAGWTPAGDDR